MSKKKVDGYNAIDINIKQLHKQEFNKLQGSQLVLGFTGKSVSPSLVNTFRRLSYLYIPTYAFNRGAIEIEKNSSIYNNDYMKLRLSQLTIPKVKNSIIVVPEKYWKDVDYADPTREKLPQDKKVLEMYINEKNDSKDIMNVTTDHAKVFENGQENKNKFKNISPILLIKLRPGEEFSCHAVGVLGLAKRDDIWAAAGNAYFENLDEKDNNNYKFIIESQGQMDEYEILYKSCLIFKKKMENLKYIINDKYNTAEIKGQHALNIVIDNEDHTIGSILNEYLQMNNNVAFSGLSKPDLLVDKIVIKMISTDANPIKPLFETFDYLDMLFTDIETQLVKLGKNFINVDNKEK